MKLDVSEKIVQSLISSGVVPTEDKELYKFGIKHGILMVINILSVVLIGFALGMIVESIVFILAYIPIRSYAGGYHASTELRCYLLSLAFVTVLLMEIKAIQWDSFNILLLSLLSAMLIFMLAPIEDLNKPLDQLEKIVYRKRTRIVLIVLLLAAFLSWIAGIKLITFSIIVALEAVSILLLFGFLKNRKVKMGKSKSLYV